MGTTKKKTAVSKAASRPLKNVGPPDASMVASAGSTRATKNDMKVRVIKTRSRKGSYISLYPKADDVNDEDDDESPDLSSKSKFTDDDGFDFDIEFTTDEDSDAYSVSSNIKSKGSGNSNNTSNRNSCGAVPDPNGRVKGRDLIPWTRPRMIEKLILHLQYEAELAGIKLPWDAAVKRLHPGSKEGAAIQQLTKLRGILLTEGHMVPPKAKVKNKRGLEYNPQIRGYIRPDGAGPYDTRVVGWGEKIVDLSKNIENPGINRGSGKYPRHNKASAQSIAGPDQYKHRSGSGDPTNSKPSLMVTLKLPPKLLAKFPSGPGSDRSAKDDQNVNIRKDGDQESHNAEVETGITENSDDFEDPGEKSELEKDSMSAHKNGSAAIKSEYFDDEGDYKHMDKTVEEANVYNPNQALNWPTGNLSDSQTVNLHSGQSGLYGNEMMTTFGSAAGTLACPAQFGIFSDFSPFIGGSSGHQQMYSAGHLGLSVLGHGSYTPLETMSMGLTMGSQINQNTVIPTQFYPSYPYGHGLPINHASDVGADPTLADLSSGGVTPGIYERHRVHRATADLKDKNSSNVDNSAIANDHAATGLYSLDSPPISSPAKQFSNDSSGGDDSGVDDTNFDVADYLNHSIFETMD